MSAALQRAAQTLCDDLAGGPAAALCACCGKDIPGKPIAVPWYRTVARTGARIDLLFTCGRACAAKQRATVKQREAEARLDAKAVVDKERAEKRAQHRAEQQQQEEWAEQIRESERERVLDPPSALDLIAMAEVMRELDAETARIESKFRVVERDGERYQRRPRALDFTPPARRSILDEREPSAAE